MQVVSFFASQCLQFGVLYTFPDSDNNHTNFFVLVNQNKMDFSEHPTARNDNVRETFAVDSSGVVRCADIFVIIIKNFYLL